MDSKTIFIGIVVIMVIVGIFSVFSSGDGDNGSYETTVYGINFHIPEGYEESNRADYTNGEYVDFKKDGWIIEISVSTDTYFKESKYIDAKVSKSINGKDGTLYIYKAPSNGVAYVYYDYGKQVIIRGATNSELEEIII